MLPVKGEGYYLETEISVKEPSFDLNFHESNFPINYFLNISHFETVHTIINQNNNTHKFDNREE